MTCEVTLPASRHNTYCEPGVYSLFALCEYVVVLSNMAFNYVIAMDFGERRLHI